MIAAESPAPLVGDFILMMELCAMAGVVLASAHFAIKDHRQANEPELPGYQIKQFRILHAMQAYIGMMTPNELSDLLGTDAEQVLRVLEGLKRGGYVDSLPQGHHNPLEHTWRITGKGTNKLLQNPDPLRLLDLTFPT